MDKKNKKSFIKQYDYGLIRMFEEVEMVPIIGVKHSINLVLMPSPTTITN